MTYPNRLQVTYDGQPSLDFDDVLRDAFRSLGYDNWASGYNLEKGQRDLIFDLLDEEEEDRVITGRED